jgi:hypothetical protein
VKRWHYFALAAAVAAGAFYVYTHRESFGLGNLPRLWGSSDTEGSDEGAGRPARMNWQTLERTNDSFKVDLPAEPKDLQVPAYNEVGGQEAVKMIVASPDDDTTFAVTWEDNPPVARANRTPERTLKMARDGMLARTQTTIVRESNGFQRGNPSLDVAARNKEGGILDARLIFLGNRLYMLIALFPSASARRDKDVTRFFDSFVPSRPPAIPESMPSASRQN